MNYYETLRRRRYFDEALGVLNDALQCARPTEKSDILCKRADTLCDLERGMLALRSIDAALKDTPDNPSYHYVRGRALGLLGELQNAKKAMERVLQLAPRYHAAQVALQEIDDALAGRPARKKSEYSRENNTMRAVSEPPSSTDMLAMLVLQNEISLEVKILAGELIALRFQVDRWFLLRKATRLDFPREQSISLLEMAERVDQLIEEAWNSAQVTKGRETKKIEELLTNSRTELRAFALPD